MPKIEIQGNGLDGLWILAVANFPSNSELRKSFYAIRFADEELKANRAEESIEIATSLFDDLLNAPSREQMRSLVTTSTKSGLIAGDFLASIFAMHSFPEHFSEPSVRKAVEISRAFSRFSKYGDGSKLPRSENTIRKCFDEFRSVAHLWAAMRLHQAFPMRDHREIFGSSEAVTTFFGMAGALQDFGCRFIPKRAKPRRSLLDPATVWSVPSEVPRLVPPWTEPPSWMLATTRSYKARQSATS